MLRAVIPLAGMRVHAVILAGGRGERFWPLSRRARPKQLLPLLSDRPMIADTIKRLHGLVEPRDVWIVTSRDLLTSIRDAVPEVPADHVIGEPMGKNTAPAVALAAWWLRDTGPDSVAIVLPSDHRVDPAERFRNDLAEAAKVARDQGLLVVLGIRPTRAETGYGYIEMGDPIAPGSAARLVAAFREKPDAATAARYVADGRHLWNAGMFVFTPQVMLEEVRAHVPGIAHALEGMPDPGTAGAPGALERYYGTVPSVSIDVAVMERTRRAAVLPVTFAWDDLGSWASLPSQGSGGDGNVVHGRALLEDATGVIAFSEGGLVAALGVHDLVIVRTKDVTLVCPRERAQEVRALVERMKREADGESFL